MRPLSDGALEPVRRADQGHRAVVIPSVVAGIVVLVCMVAPIVLFGFVAGDPYGRGFVERRDDGLYAQLRTCDGDSIHTVDVSPYDESAGRPPKPFWTAKATARDGVPAIRLFRAQPDVHASTIEPRLVPAEYEVVINGGRASESSVVVRDARIAVGRVEFGGDQPIARSSYLAMSDADFGC